MTTKQLIVTKDKIAMTLTLNEVEERLYDIIGRAFVLNPNIWRSPLYQAIKVLYRDLQATNIQNNPTLLCSEYLENK